MTFESFSPGNSWLHKMDSRIKIVTAVALAFSLSLCQHFICPGSGLLLGVILVTAARLQFTAVMWRLLVVNGFIALLWITLSLTYPGPPLFSFGPLSLSRPGLELAALITLKSNAIVLLFIALLATSTVAELGHGLEALGVPRKFCLLLLFSYRYIFVISQEYLRLNRAAKLRGFRPATNLHTYNTYGNLFGMTLVRSWNRAGRVRQAMVLRGFHGRFYTLSSRNVGIIDLLFLVVIAIIVTGLVFMEINHGLTLNFLS
jgi:cobalt/nickel transport system permease protein